MQDIWQDLLIDDNGENYEDTFIGNPTNLLGYNFVWFANRVKEITKGDIREELEYNYDGTLNIRKIYKNNTLEKQLKYYYDDGKLIYEEGNEKLYFMYDKDEIVGLKYSGKTYYYVKDLFGTITRICDEEGNIVVEYEYDAYGNVQEIKGTQKEILGKINPIIYKGYYYDSNVELYYCNTRYYNPKICRFISPDGVTYLNPESINGLNLYTYANNNPITIKHNATNIEIISTSSSKFATNTISPYENGRNNNLSFILGLYEGVSLMYNFADTIISSGEILDGLLSLLSSPRFKEIQSKYSKTSLCMVGIGLGLDIVLSAIENFNNDDLTSGEQWALFGADAGYSTVKAGLSFVGGLLLSKGAIFLGTTAGCAAITYLGVGFLGASLIAGGIVVVGIIASAILTEILSERVDNWWINNRKGLVI